MRIAVYELRQDEKKKLEELKEKHGIELVTTGKTLNKQTLKLCAGCEGVSILGRSSLDEELLAGLKKQGTGYISTRTIGYNHIDARFAKEIGLKICNAGYPPKGVAEFAVMLMLLTLRHYKPAMWRQNVNDYSLFGLTGQELGNQTVGVIGTGNIGMEVLKILSGFGCKLVASDKWEKEEGKKYAQYVSLDELYRVSDIITLHVPLLEENRHFINKEAIDKMKTGVILINTARGELMDIEALTEGIESQKIGALGLDVFEKEEGIYHADRKTDILKNRDMVYLRQFPNVVMTQHMAFYTKANIDSMVTWGIEGILDMYGGRVCRQEI
ncbi:D-isomer specific 2-hydroxyacid dehydrogenase family protein [Anaerocolumna xylanovorans]|uniref:D-lactate dehydrogenase n=1 Tax=Anaerocolumna xylanovorans DSM 12503 TaxID=1121345 RepID=A0A1M7XZ07_9FIRM|nr:D-isomer specific 2-hydroxyacid dehydrogenase family protein [Anaerocolumna xylanovorans]SHO44374.1 D-lactate dehydrogenase [Anaerocolumna xylanovorans DSM 12503]